MCQSVSFEFSPILLAIYIVPVFFLRVATMDFCDLLMNPPPFPGGTSALKKPFIYESNYIQMLLGRLLCNRKTSLAHTSPYRNMKN